MYDSIVNAINNVWWFIWSIVDWIWNFFTGVLDFFVAIYEILVNIASFIISAIWFIYFAWKTLIVWVARLLYDVLDGSVFYNVNRAFVYISDYIWWPATIFLSALLLIIIIRIIIAFVFKLMKMNIDYNSFDKQSRKANAWSNASEYHKRSSTRV